MTELLIGIPHARDARDARGQVWPRAAIDEQPQPFRRPLACARCDAAVHARRGGPRRSKTGRVFDVSSCYYLHNGGEHEPGCPYDYERRARGLCHDSAGTVVADRAGRWRLLLPTDSDLSPAATGPRPGVSNKPRRKLQITANRRSLTPAITSAAKIVRLLAAFDQDPGATDRFRADTGQHQLTWDQFCYGPEDYQRLADTLAARRLDHPIAVHGSTHALEDRGDTHRLRATDRATCEGRPISLVLRAREPQLLEAARHRNWLAYGRWKHWTGSAGYRELQLWITKAWQITTWNPAS